MRKPINRLKHRCRCAFAILLSIPFIFNCFGFTAVAEDFASAPIELSESFDEIIDIEEVLSTDIEEPVEVIEYPLDLESLSGEEDTAESAGTVNALIEWGEMLFSCHEQNTDQGLSYYWACDDGSNIVTVTNTSETTPIRACYSYEPNMDGFCAPLYAFPSAEEAEAAGREMTLDGFDAHNLAEGFNGDMIAPGETETWYVIFTAAPDVERALSEEDYLSVGRLSATVVPAE